MFFKLHQLFLTVIGEFSLSFFLRVLHVEFSLIWQYVDGKLVEKRKNKFLFLNLGEQHSSDVDLLGFTEDPKVDSSSKEIQKTYTYFFEELVLCIESGFLTA